MKILRLCLALSSISLGAASRSSADLIVNGGFETGDFTGWTQSGNTGYTGVDGVDPHSGNYAAYFGPVGSLGYISQDVSGLTVGSTYSLSFYLFNYGGVGTEYTASFGGTTLVDVVDAPAFDYTLFSYSVVATSSTETLKFGFQQDPSYFYLDDVSLNFVSGPAAVPVPPSIVMTAVPALIGLVGAGARRLRRESAPSIA